MEENKILEENVKEEKNDLTDKDFYDQACQYFYYHAEQRMTMINYFIAVFGAGIALYGNFIEKNPTVGFLISTFLLIISILFCSIDLRNKFDVKQSQSVIAQIEKDYGRDKLKGNDAKATYGVFSNEDNTFRYYGREHRKEEGNEEYRELQKLYKQIKALKKKKASEEQIDKLEEELENRVELYLENDGTISKKEFKSSIGKRSIRSLSNSIKYMYYLCMLASLGGMVWSILEGELIYTVIKWIRLILN